MKADSISRNEQNFPYRCASKIVGRSGISCTVEVEAKYMTDQGLRLLAPSLVYPPDVVPALQSNLHTSVITNSINLASIIT
jgi:hypothetical protein